MDRASLALLCAGIVERKRIKHANHNLTSAAIRNFSCIITRKEQVSINSHSVTTEVPMRFSGGPLADLTPVVLATCGNLRALVGSPSVLAPSLKSANFVKLVDTIIMVHRSKGHCRPYETTCMYVCMLY